MTLAVREEENALVFELDGEFISSEGLQEFEATYRPHMADDHRFVIDFADVPVLNSDALRAIVVFYTRLGNAAAEHGLAGPEDRVRFCGLTDDVKEILRLTRLDRVLRVVSDVETALFEFQQD